MCDQFQKALKRKFDTETYRKQDQEAIRYLKRFVNDNNQLEFFDKYVGHLDEPHLPPDIPSEY